MRRASSITMVVAALLIAARAHAHLAAAEPPLYPPGPCIVVADAREQPLLHFQYMVLLDDTELSDGDIRVADAKTHQFFALAGALVQSAIGGYELVPFEPTGEIDPEPRHELPLWITTDDVARAAAAVAGSGTMFTAGEVPREMILDMSTAFAGRALRIDADDARRPITSAQADIGISVLPATMPPGLYTIAAYIFSPPYNGWAPMPGLLKVVSAERDTPAAQLASIAGVVRSFQGRRVRACVHAPEGTTVRGSYRVNERPELGWREWLPAQPLDAASEQLEHCFQSADPALSGSIRLRLELRAPDGTTIAAYSPDTLTALAGNGTCEPSDTVCCPPPVAPPDASVDATPEAPATQSPASCSASPSGCSRLAGLLLLALLIGRKACHNRREPRL